ncbi:hypothetical protein M3Y98_00577200 [Aphelenchoides besseyi]|nr:hypothetical protein M3Y98_00577200 [Aphelenchoides besseyi]
MILLIQQLPNYEFYSHANFRRWHGTAPSFPLTLHQKNAHFLDSCLSYIIKVIADQLNATIEPHTLYDSGNKDEKIYIGRIGKSRIDGLMGFVYANEVDTIGINIQSKSESTYPLQKTIIRHGQFDFSTELYEVEFNILHARYHDQLNTLWSYFMIYDRSIWIIMFCCLFLQGLFYMSKKFCDCAIWTAVQLHLGQALNVTWKSYAVKFNILLVSVFQVIILMGKFLLVLLAIAFDKPLIRAIKNCRVYSSYSLSQKLTIDGVANIDGPKELIEALESGERYFVSTTASDWFYEALNRSDAYPYKSLRRAVKRNPIYIAQTETEALERASSNGGLLVVSQDHPLNIQAKNYCNLVPMDDPIALVSTHLIFKKDSPLVDAVNQAIQVNRIAILKLVRKYMEYQKRIDNPACHKLRAPVDMPVYGLCLMWLIMMGCSIVCLFIELAVYYFRSRRKETSTGQLPILFRRASVKPTEK